jgi:hypothetical protein
MSTRSLTIEISAEMYDALSRRAADAHRSVADELVLAVQKDVAGEQLSPELEAELAALPAAGDAALQAIAQSRLSEADRVRLEELHQKKGSQGLSSAEENEAVELLERYDRCLVLRAHALALLKQRGYDLTPLLHS